MKTEQEIKEAITSIKAMAEMLLTSKAPKSKETKDHDDMITGQMECVIDYLNWTISNPETTEHNKLIDHKISMFALIGSCLKKI